MDCKSAIVQGYGNVVSGEVPGTPVKICTDTGVLPFTGLDLTLIVIMSLFIIGMGIALLRVRWSV